jgi:epoxyqueuosine reductase QueG
MYEYGVAFAGKRCYTGKNRKQLAETGRGMENIGKVAVCWKMRSRKTAAGLRRGIGSQYEKGIIMNLNQEIIASLNQEGCNIVGFADLRCLSKETRQNFNTGIVLALSYSKEAMWEHQNGSMRRYHDEWKPMTFRLDELAALTARLLTAKGYKALPQVSATVVQDKYLRTVLPHKTVATLAGIGWIGKCAMLVTNEVGSALRIKVVLTNAPLTCGTPATTSLCPPDCAACADACPGKAPRGGLWEAGVDRDSFFDAHACRDAALDRAKATLGIDETLCGLCISSCPFTKTGLGYE